MKINSHGVTIHSEFSGGNILVDTCDGYHVELRPDMRDTTGHWFYWYFEVQVESSRRLHFHFPKDLIPFIGVHGPAVSADGGRTWDWLYAEEIGEAHSWSYDFKEGDAPLRFAVGLPYVSQDLDQFANELNHAFELSTFCTSKEGRQVPAWHHTGQSNLPIIIVTARQHACETSGSYIMEGMLEYWAKLSEAPTFLAIPFMDIDGVENGDQGKNRSPHDHNRDYQHPCLYPESTALMDRIQGMPRHFVIVDLHCPYIRGGINQTIYLVGSRRPDMALRQKAFSHQLKAYASGLPYDEQDFIEYGKDWNTDKNYLSGKHLIGWAEEQAQCQLSTVVEIPYANAKGTPICPNRLRKFGASLAEALVQSIKIQAFKGS